MVVWCSHAQKRQLDLPVKIRRIHAKVWFWLRREKPSCLLKQDFCINTPKSCQGTDSGACSVRETKDLRLKSYLFHGHYPPRGCVPGLVHDSIGTLSNLLDFFESIHGQGRADSSLFHFCSRFSGRLRANSAASSRASAFPDWLTFGALNLSSPWLAGSTVILCPDLQMRSCADGSWSAGSINKDGGWSGFPELRTFPSSNVFWNNHSLEVSGYWQTINCFEVPRRLRCFKFCSIKRSGEFRILHVSHPIPTCDRAGIAIKCSKHTCLKNMKKTR